ncbi:MAG TPA: aldo/keto reductase [Anaerolineales bacterium]|nr:aldo/keto reductase [Anaerolineales bacterium]
MEYRRLGKSGFKVSELCMGTMQFGWTADEPTAFRILDASRAAGINFIDTADVYSRWVEGNPGGVAETIVGKWLQASSVPRDQIVLATKVRGRMGEGPNDEGLSRGHILNAAHESLRRLGTDYIDLYQLHFPDDETPIEETLEALTDLVRRGDVRYIGCSNFPAWRTVEALWAADRRNLASFASTQPHYNLVHRAEFESEVQDVCSRYGLAVLPYSPLAGGFLTGKYRRGQEAPAGTRGVSSPRVREHLQSERAWHVLDEVRAIAVAKGKSPSQVALAWLLANPLVTSPIIGPRSMDQLEDNLGGVGWSFSDDELQSLQRAGQPETT